MIKHNIFLLVFDFMLRSPLVKARLCVAQSKKNKKAPRARASVLKFGGLRNNLFIFAGLRVVCRFNCQMIEVNLDIVYIKLSFG